MGNAEQSKAQTNFYSHPRLGNIKRVQEKTDTYYLVYEAVLENQKLYDDWAFELQKISQISEDILFLPFHHEYNQTNFCGTGGLARLKFQDYLYSLQPEIKNRKQIKRPFNQQELFYLFYSLVKIQALLESRGKSVGDIKPENILVNEDGYVKVVSQYSWPGEQSRIVGRYINHQRIFFSPQECEDRFRRRDANTPNYQRNQCEVYSIAMTILEAGTLKDCSEIYSSEVRIADSKLRQFLDIFQMRYSKELNNLLKQMLHTNPRKRIKAEVIYEMLKPFEYNILNLQEIDLRTSVFESIPRVEREEKISIKRLGESQFSHPDYQESIKYQTTPYPFNQKPSNFMKISLGSNQIPNHYPHQQLANSQQNPFAQSLESGFFQVNRQNSQPSINYQLVNENTNFGRLLSPNAAPHSQNTSPFFGKSAFDDRQVMLQSLPVSMVQYEQRNNTAYQPQYVTQNSMVENVGRPSNQSDFTSYS